MSQFRQHTFAPSEMSKEDAIAKLKKGTMVRHDDTGRVAEVVTPPDSEKNSGRFGVKGDRKNTRNQRPDKWTIVPTGDNQAAMKEDNQAAMKKDNQAAMKKEPAPKIVPDTVREPEMTKKHEIQMRDLIATQQQQILDLKKESQMTYDNALQQLEAIHRDEMTALELKFETETNGREVLLSRHRQQTNNLKEQYRKSLEELKQQQQNELQEFETRWQ